MADETTPAVETTPADEMTPAVETTPAVAATETREPPAEDPPGGAIVPVDGGLAAGRSGSRTSVSFVLARSALLAGLCRFVPVPLLDDYLERNVHRFMIASLLKRATRGYHVTHVEPLYVGVGDWLSGCLGWVVGLPVRLVVKLLKKAFKSVFVVLLVREAGLSMATAVLLGHTVDRALRAGALRGCDDPTARALLDEAALFRRAFDAAFAGTDRRFVAHLLGRVFVEIKRLPRLGARAVRVMFGRRAAGTDAPGQPPSHAEPIIERGIEEVHEVLQHDDVRSFRAEFETLFDRALDHQRAVAAAPAGARDP